MLVSFLATRKRKRWITGESKGLPYQKRRGADCSAPSLLNTAHETVELKVDILVGRTKLRNIELSEFGFA